ncbi:hypothetical protein CK203_032402 [Vitis vinifera]|uniref:Retrotransposon gag domain-containing protein n=1 Tax=Vitis vinifera TaxID=29760 RepID=A0A438IJX3_VITVI|nr:hypothetical protein CK203_032402 [Vitis vinifera]
MELESKPSHNGHLYDSRVLIIHPNFGLPPQDHVLELIEYGVTSLEESWRSIDQSRFTSEFRQFSLDVRRASFHTCFYSGVHDRGDGIPAASLPVKFRMPDIERYSGIDCPKIHLRLYSTVMRAHGIDDAQFVALFPMLLSGAAQRWFASVKPSRLRTWEDVAHEFLTQFAFNADIYVAGMIDRPKKQDQNDMVIWNLQPSVEEAIAQGLWTDTTTSPDSKGKKPIGSPSGSEEEPYIAQTSMQPRPPHPRATTHSPPRPYAQRDAGLIVPLALHSLPHPIPPHFHSHEHCLYDQIQGHDTERCSVLHHAVQDLINSGLVNLFGPSVTTNPLPTHSTHAVPSSPSLQ